MFSSSRCSSRPLPISWILASARGPGSAVMLLYGDNGPSGRPIREEPILCEFFTVAGLMMDKLHRQTAASRPAIPGRPAGRI